MTNVGMTNWRGRNGMRDGLEFRHSVIRTSSFRACRSGVFRRWSIHWRDGHSWLWQACHAVDDDFFASLESAADDAFAVDDGTENDGLIDAYVFVIDTKHSTGLPDR